MASIIMKRGTTSEISNTPISDGQILFETDTKNIYIDKGSNRIEYRATTIDIDSELNTTSENPVQNKVVTTNINTTKANLGDVTSLTTTDKSSVVGAVNELNSNSLKHTLLTTYSTASTWSGAIHLGAATTIIEIAVLNSSNLVVASQVISAVVAQQSSSSFPCQIYSGSTLVAQFYVDSSNRLYLFNYAGYKSKIYC